MNNTVILVGRLTKDLELRATSNGKDVVSFTLAVGRNFKNKEGNYETDFFNCKLYGSIAKTMSEYCHKGDIIGVKGSLQNSSYEKEGQKVYTTEVIAERVTFLQSKPNETKEENKTTIILDEVEPDEMPF